MTSDKFKVPIPSEFEATDPIADSRAFALNILNRLDQGKKTLDAILDDSAPRIQSLSKRDRALLNQLVYGVLRWRLRLDTIIDAHANRPLRKIAPTVLNILRIGLFQILFLDRIPQSAAVNTSANLTKAQKTHKAVGFVNALLRNVLREPHRSYFPDAATAPADHIATSKSFPRWLTTRWINRFGITETENLCDAMNTIPPITLRCNRLKNTPSKLMETLKAEAEHVADLEGVPGGVTMIRPLRPLSEMKAFDDGRFSIQDGAAQMISLLLAPEPGETVLDVCAGLGGKTTHVAQMMENQGLVMALDNVAAKLSRLEKEAQRLGISIIRTQCMDLNHPMETGTLPLFDRILLDAPCSGLGVLRRNPDAKWSSSEKNFTRFTRRQTRFLDRLAPLLKLKGTLVFAVCSMEPEENEQVIKTFLKNHANFAIVKSLSNVEQKVLSCIGEDGYFRSFPHIHHMDGFFAARLQRMH